MLNSVVAIGKSVVAGLAYRYGREHYTLTPSSLPAAIPIQDGAIISRTVYRGGDQPPTPWNKSVQKLNGFDEYDDYFQAADVPTAACEVSQTKRSADFLTSRGVSIIGFNISESFQQTYKFEQSFRSQQTSKSQPSSTSEQSRRLSQEEQSHFLSQEELASNGEDDIRQCQLDLEPELMLSASLWSTNASVPFYVICTRDETCSGIFYKGDGIVRTGMNADMGAPTKWKVRTEVGVDRESLLQLLQQLSARSITREEYYATIRTRLKRQFAISAYGKGFDQETLDETEQQKQEIVRWNSGFFYNDTGDSTRESKPGTPTRTTTQKKRPVLPNLIAPVGHPTSEFVKTDQGEVLAEILEQGPAPGEDWNEVVIAATSETVSGFWSEDLTYACLLREDFHSRYPLLKSSPAFLLVRKSNTIQDVTDQCQSIVQACNSDTPPRACLSNKGTNRHMDAVDNYI